MLKLDNWKKLVKSKRFLILAVVIVLICVVVGVVLGVEATKYECTLNDIRECEKCYGSVYGDIIEKNISLEDYMSLAIYVDHELNDNECSTLERRGLNIYRNYYFPPVGAHPYGYYLAEAQVEDICRFYNSDLIVRITSTEGTPGHE